MTDMIRKSDALALLNEYVGWADETISRLQNMPAVKVGVIHEELNTEQSKAFWNWLPLAYRDGHLGVDAKFTKYNMEVAHYAGWMAALTPTAVDASQAADPAVNAPEMRPETVSENMARDMREGRFPKRSEPQMVPVEPAAPDPAAIRNDSPNRAYRVGYAAGRAAALRDAKKALRDWQDDLNTNCAPETAITVGMAADVVAALIPTKGATK